MLAQTNLLTLWHFQSLIRHSVISGGRLCLIVGGVRSPINAGGAGKREDDVGFVALL